MQIILQPNYFNGYVRRDLDNYSFIFRRGVTAPIPAPATLPATPTVVVAALPATFSGTVTTAHELMEPRQMRLNILRSVNWFFFIILSFRCYSLIALMTPDFIFFQVLI